MVKVIEVSNYPGYYAFSDGTVWSTKSNKFLKPCLNSNNGYCSLALRNEEGEKRKELHRWILESFVGPCPDGFEACHNNGDRLDNRLENLRWDTRSANRQDAMKHGTWESPGSRGENIGTSNGRAKLMDKDIILIKDYYYDYEYKQKDIAKLFDITQAHVSAICLNKIWKHL